MQCSWLPFSLLVATQPAGPNDPFRRWTSATPSTGPTFADGAADDAKADAQADAGAERHAWEPDGHAGTRANADADAGALPAADAAPVGRADAGADDRAHGRRRPPNVLSARFTSTGENILVDLDAASDQAGMLAGEYFPCAELLDFADVDTAECFWVGATQIYAEVNKALNFVPGENVTLRAQTTMLACDDDRCDCRVGNDASSVPVDPPDPLPDVEPVFQAPDSIAVCEEGGLAVDASQSIGSGGRDWTRLVWSVNATGPPESRGSWANATAALQSMRRAATDLSSEFTAEDSCKRSPPTVVLSLDLENFLGSTKTESVEVALSTKSIPSVLIVGGANQRRGSATR